MTRLASGRHLSRRALPAAALLAALLATQAMAAELPAAARNFHCETCHGVDGNSRDPAIPRLNGQRADYITRRMSAFLDLPSQSPHSWTMSHLASQMRGETFAQIGAYYAAFPPSPARPDRRYARQGEQLFLHGAPAQDIAACASCHGAQGEGSAAAPRLAGQHAAYLNSQLESMRLNVRVSTPMFHNLFKTTDGQIRALTAYLSGD